MTIKETPLEIDGVTESLYAGFWTRLASLLLDAIIMVPIIFLTLYLNGLGKNIYFITFIVNFIIGIWYGIYLPKKYGGTPGKLIVGIKIIRLDGQSIDWKESFLRYIINLLLSLFSAIMMTVCILQADDSVFTSLSWLKQTQYLMSLSPKFFKVHTWISNIWVYGELAVLLTNERKRAIHDFIAGTVIVKAKYIDQIRQAMQQDENPQSE
jgi:uncharacterized RDD family membrane protein YckC